MKLEITDDRESFITFGELEALEGFEYSDTLYIKFIGIGGDAALDLNKGITLLLNPDAPVHPCDLELTIK